MGSVVIPFEDTKRQNRVLKEFFLKRDHHKTNVATPRVMKHKLWKKTKFSWENTITKIMLFQGSCYSCRHHTILTLLLPYYHSHTTNNILPSHHYCPLATISAIMYCLHAPSDATIPSYCTVHAVPSHATIRMLSPPSYCLHDTIPVLPSPYYGPYATIPLLPPPWSPCYHVQYYLYKTETFFPSQQCHNNNTAVTIIMYTIQLLLLSYK